MHLGELWRRSGTGTAHEHVYSFMSQDQIRDRFPTQEKRGTQSSASPIVGPRTDPFHAICTFPPLITSLTSR